MKVTNSSKTPRALPRGPNLVEVPPGGSIEYDPAEWEGLAKRKSISGLVASGKLTVTAEQPAKEAGADKPDPAPASKTKKAAGK